MNIKVMSRQEALAYSYKQDVDNYIIVSISCPDETGPIFYTPSKLKDIKRKGILRLWFNDIDRPYENKEPKEEQFIGLKAFIDTFKDNPEVKDIIVHCAAGISRSSAVAAAICQYLGLNELDIIWSNYIYVPNTLVYKLALKELGLKWCEEQFAYYLAMNKLERDKLEIPEDIENLFKE
jgi:hypothetical protein